VEIGIGRTEDNNTPVPKWQGQVLDWWSNAFHTFFSSMSSPIMRIVNSSKQQIVMK
jgi:hypothetical protein